MKSWPRALAMILALLALTVLAVSSGEMAAPVGAAEGGNVAPLAQSLETAWIIWETSAPIQGLALDGDSLWAGAYKGGLFQWDLERGPVASYSTGNGLPGRDVISIAVDASGNTWVALFDGGVARSSGGGFADMTPAGIAGEDPWALAARGGDVWLATLGGGVPRRSGGSWTTYSHATDGLPSNEIYAIAVEADGTPWIGTMGYGVAARQGGGVSRLHASGSWSGFDTSNSPMNEDDVLDVVVDGNGGLWLASYDAGLTFYGALPTIPPLFDLDPRGEPTYLPGKVKGYYLWLDPATYEWTLAWSGDERRLQGDGEYV